MPSIPQSLLWISLVVLWLFVLVPMLISKRDAVRRTSDVALATRVLNSGQNARLRRNGPAAGHRSDPNWQPSEDDLDSDLDDDDYEPEPARTVVKAAAVRETEEPDYLDVDVVEEDAEALPAGSTQTEESVEEEQPVAQADPQLPLGLDDPDELIEVGEEAPADQVEAADEPVTDEFETGYDDAPPEPDDADEYEYEYVADSSGLEPSSDEMDDVDDEPVAEAAPEPRRRPYESKTAAAVSARKFKFRKRMVMCLMVALVASAAAALLLTPSVWWVCAVVGGFTLLYLFYLRRQTRIEEQLRRRRAQRMMRSRLGVENTDDRELDVVPSRLRRPGAAVLEIDDEDPEFEHLDYAPLPGEYDLPRAAGQ